MFDVNNAYKQKKEYFKPLYEEIENGGIAAMMYDLLRMDLKDFHPRYDVPKTKALQEQKHLSLKPAEQWWHQLLETGVLPRAKIDDACVWNPRRATYRLLFDEARKTVPGLRFASDTLLGRILAGYKCGKCRISKTPAWQFPPLTEARKDWDKILPGTDWDDETEWGSGETSF